MHINLVGRDMLPSLRNTLLAQHMSLFPSCPSMPVPTSWSLNPFKKCWLGVLISIGEVCLLMLEVWHHSVPLLLLRLEIVDLALQILDHFPGLLDRSFVLGSFTLPSNNLLLLRSLTTILGLQLLACLAFLR